MRYKFNKLSLFIFAGICSNATNIVTFYILVNLIKASIYISGSVAYFIGLFVGFYLNSTYTFKVNQTFKSKFVTYLLIQITIYFLYSLYNIFVINYYREYNLILHIFGIGMCAILNFIMLDFFWNKNESRSIKKKW